jgi:hypothetical protein
MSGKDAGASGEMLVDTCDTLGPSGPGNSGSKNGVASLAYVPAICAILLGANVYKDVDARHKAGHDDSHYLPRRLRENDRWKMTVE